MLQLGSSFWNVQIMSSESSIESLLSVISSNTSKYQKYLQAQALPLPSHNAMAPDIAVSRVSLAPLPKDIEEALNAATEASHELHQLLLRPVGRVLEAAVQVGTLE